MLREHGQQKESNGMTRPGNEKCIKSVGFFIATSPARYSMGSFYRKEIGQSTSY